jgi:uncharacterized protein (DUF1778 family)
MARPRLVSAKREKIELRVTAEQKLALRAAARLAGLPMSTWVLLVALEAARAHTSSCSS